MARSSGRVTQLGYGLARAQKSHDRWSHCSRLSAPAEQKKTPATFLATYCLQSCQVCSSFVSSFAAILPQSSAFLRICGASDMPWQIGPKISVSPGCGTSNPNNKPLSSAEALATDVPDPARRRTKPACCNSRTARPTVILEVQNRFNRAPSLGSFWPGRYRPERMSVLIPSRTC